MNGIKAKPHSASLRLLLGASLTVGLGRTCGNDEIMNTGPEEPTKARLGEVGVNCENDHAPLVLVHLPTCC